MKRLIGIVFASLMLAACGGGGSSPAPTTPPTTPKTKLVGEVIASADEIRTAEISTTAGYAVGRDTSLAIKAAGKQNLLDLQFVYPAATPQGRVLNRLDPDAEVKLIQYANDNRDLLIPGTRVLVLDEIYWNPPDQSDDAVGLQQQFDVFRTAVELVRKRLPGVSVGFTVVPYSTFGRANTLDFIKRALPLVDWVGTDPYILNDLTVVNDLHAWTRSFSGVAKSANPSIETWFIAQAFKLPQTPFDNFNSYISQQLLLAEQYDHIIFFGWQFTNELLPETAGARFPISTKNLYRKYLKQP